MSITPTRYFSTWLDARNASCLYSTDWTRIGCAEGFVMVHSVSRQLIALIVEVTS